jgi:hypothetical protein
MLFVNTIFFYILTWLLFSPGTVQVISGYGAIFLFMIG